MEADDTKKRVLEAAGRVFSEKGYEAATVRDICELAGANIASVKYYYGDKQSLYLAACVEAQCAREGAVPMPAWEPGVPASVRLQDFIRTFLRRLFEEERPAWHRQLMLREMASPTDACAHVVEDYIRPMASILQGILQEMMPPGTPEIVGFQVGFSIVGQCLFYHVHQPIAERLMGAENYRQLTIEQLADHIVRFSLAALGYGEPLSKDPAAAGVVGSQSPA